MQKEEEDKQHDCVQYRAALIEFPESTTKAVNPDEPITFVASTEEEDRYNDIVRVDGWNLSNFKKNPIALFGHRHDSIVGHYPNVWVEGKRLMAQLKLAAAGTSQLVDSIRALVAQRILRAVSVGFLPLEYKAIVRDDRFIGYEFVKQDLMEISLVAVPANPEALSVARSLNLPAAIQQRLFVPAIRGVSAQRARVELEKLKSARV